MKVEELSDDQIVKIIAEADKRGLSDAQLMQSLGQQGLSGSEQQKLRSRMAAVRGNALAGQRATDLVTPTEETGRRVEDEVQLVESVEEEVEAGVRNASRIFGSGTFRNRNMSFAPNLRLPTPQNYIIGTDDQLLIDLTGDNEANYRLRVSPEGTIRIDYVGIVSVAGLTIEDAREKVKNQMESVYPQLRSGGTRLSLTLGDIRSIKVTLTGYVTRPGTYTLPSLANVFHALYAAGGPSNKGTYRAIQLIRNNRVIETIDTYDFITKGIQSNNVRLEDQDVIHIPVVQMHVSFDGFVKTQGVFEPIVGETLQDLLGYAGGFATEAYTARIKVLKLTDKERTMTDIYPADYGRYLPKNGDQFIVEQILDRYDNRVEISGAIFRPGQYALTEGLTLRQLIDKADGLKEDAYIERAYINRLNPDNTQQLITVNLAKLLDGNVSEDEILQREDRVIISSIFDLRDEYTVRVSGQVRRPGQFPFVENMTLGNLIHMAGGLSEAANIERVDIARRIRRNTNERDTVLSELLQVRFDNPEQALQSDFELQPYDLVSVHTATGYQRQKQVRIEGEIQLPGVYTLLTKDETISDLIRRAGGVTEYAYLPGASLQRKASDAKVGLDHGVLSAQARNELAELERDQAAVRSLALENTRRDSAATSLFFSNYVGIKLDRALAGSRKHDIPLEDEDVIIVPKRLRTVLVRGQVLNPNRIVYEKGKPLGYYIKQAGGFTAKAHKRKTFVQHANGAVEGTSLNYPQVLPGSEIIVPAKPEREKLSVQAWISMGSVVTSLAAVVVSLLR